MFFSITWYSSFSPFYRNFTTPLIGKITCLPKSKRRCFFGLFKMNRWSYNHITEIHKSLDSVISDIQGFKLASSSQSDSTRHRYFIFNFTKKISSIYLHIIFYAFATLYRPSPPVSWPRRHRTSTMTSEANTEEDLDLNFSSENANTNEEQIRIEAWLDEHPDFFQEYLIRKGM